MGEIVIPYPEELSILFDCYRQAKGNHKKMVKYLIDMELALAVNDKAIAYNKMKQEISKEEAKANTKVVNLRKPDE